MLLLPNRTTGYIILIISFFTYYIFLEYILQKTIAKYITKTKVTKIDGKKPELLDIVGRTVFRIIPFDRISFIFTRNGFHDYLSKTIVVKD